MISSRSILGARVKIPAVFSAAGIILVVAWQVPAEICNTRLHRHAVGIGTVLCATHMGCATVCSHN